jgi:hypothetical protein
MTAPPVLKTTSITKRLNFAGFYLFFLNIKNNLLNQLRYYSLLALLPYIGYY